ncbi:MAG: YceI family protein, partial [Pseudomonadota bacterium]
WLPFPHLPGFGGLPEGARENLTDITEHVHAWLAYGAGVLVLLHVAGALKHHLADGTFINRMSLFAKGDGPRRAYGQATTTIVTLLVAGALVGSAALSRYGGSEVAQAPAQQGEQAAADTPAAPESAPADVPAPGAAPTDDAAVETAGAPAPPPQWIVLPEASRLTFRLTHNGAEVEGGFEAFDATIIFDPDNLDASSIAVAIDTTSAFIDSSEISRGNLSSRDGFDNRNHGTARFESDTIRADGAGYVAEGMLTIRDETHPQTLAFTVAIEGDRASAQGALTLNRLSYGVGEDNDPSGDTMSTEVTVNVVIEATRGAPAPAPAPAPTDATTSGDAAAVTGETPVEAADTEPLEQSAPLWTVFADESRLTYAFDFQGGSVTGDIGSFDAEIRFDESNLPGSSILATMDLESVTVESGDLSASQVRGSDGLAASREPTARFEAATVEAGADGGYVARGTLTARGVSQEIALPFTLVENGDRWVAEGTVALDRAAYGFAEDAGLGDDIGANVKVAVTIVAAAPPEIQHTR